LIPSNSFNDLALNKSAATDNLIMQNHYEIQADDSKNFKKFYSFANFKELYFNIS
jgi:hypothetical protein